MMVQKERRQFQVRRSTYTIDDGKVTFTPEDILGQATGVTVKRVDKNGTPITAKYTSCYPGYTCFKDSESEGPKGQPQSRNTNI